MENKTDNIETFHEHDSQTICSVFCPFSHLVRKGNLPLSKHH